MRHARPHTLLALALIVPLTLAMACGDDAAGGSGDATNNGVNNGVNNDVNNDTNNTPNNDNNNDAPNNDAPNNDAPNNDAPNNDAPEGCGEGLFLDLSQAEGAGDAFPAPSVEVDCTDTTMIVQSNGIPHYAFMPITPNPLRAQDHRWEIPLQPRIDPDGPTEIPLLGTAAFTISGIPVYGPNEGAMPDPYGDPVYNDILDWCMGHTGFNGDYHNHALLVECFFPDHPEDAPSPLLGFALDGFPIYGPVGCEDADCTRTVRFKSSWETVGDPTTFAWDANRCTRETCAEASGEFLDQCNGRVGPDGTYRYHITDTFPYILGCFRGVANDAGGNNDIPPGNNDNPPGPTTCQSDDDCGGACPPGSVGCACAQTPMGQLCIPTCQSNADCPQGMMGETLICGREGTCVPQR